ncbi:MAG: hypothetical protein ACYCYF_09070 [Anaerolineae bacterium]
MRTRATRIACLTLKEAPGSGLEPLWEALTAHTPAVEWSLEDATRFYLDAAGMGDRYGDRSSGEGAWCRAVLAVVRPLIGADGRHARLGVASTRFGAQVAAQIALPSPAYRVVAEPDARFLSGQALDWLPLDPESLRRLRLYGVHTIGGLAALPAVAVVEQLGPESLTAWRLASGQDARPVVGRRCQTFSASHLYDEPETRVEALVEGASRLAERALADLPVSRTVWAIRRATVQVLFVSGGAWSGEGWLGDSPGRETVRGLLERLLAGLVPADTHPRDAEADALAIEGEGVAEMTVSLLGLEPAPGRQLQLFEAQETDRQWQQIVSALTRKHAANLVRAEMVDPEAAILPQRYAYRALLP